MRRRFVFWFYWGAETRVFAFSGLLDCLANHGDVTVLSRFVRKDLCDAVDQRVRWIQMSATKGMPWPARLHSFANRAHWLWLRDRSRGLAVLDRAAVIQDSSFQWGVREVAARALARRPLLLMLNRLATRVLRGTNSNLSALDAVGESTRHTVLVSSDFLSTEGGRAVWAAKRLGMTTVFYPSNWRDVYKGARLAYPFSEWILWNRDMVSAARRNNPWLNDAHISFVASSQFDAHFRPDWLVSRDEFCRLLGADPMRPLVCYSAVNDSAYKGEAEIVERVVQACQGDVVGGSLQMVVRLNPAGSDRRYADLPSKYPGVCFVLAPEWWIERPADGSPTWRSNTPADARLFANLIEHCCANIGLPSTMMLDFAVRGRPSVCVGFDSSERGAGTSCAQDFLDQEFIRGALDDGVWPVAHSEAEAAEAVSRFAVGQGFSSELLRDVVLQAVGSCDGRVHERLAQELVSISEGKLSGR